MPAYIYCYTSDMITTSRCNTNSLVNCRASWPYFSGSNDCPALGLARGALGQLTPVKAHHDPYYIGN